MSGIARTEKAKVALVTLLFAASVAAVPAGAVFPDNDVDCEALPEVTMGQGVTIPLVGVADWWTIQYNGMSWTVPASTPDFLLSPIVGNEPVAFVCAVGIHNGITIHLCRGCAFDFAPPVCEAMDQDPTAPVPPGAAVVLTLETSGANAATIDGVPMMVVSGTPDADDEVVWESTHHADTTTTVEAVLTNPESETATCEWSIEVVGVLEIPTLGGIGRTAFVLLLVGLGLWVLRRSASARAWR